MAHPLALANACQLEQAARLVAGLTDEQYTRTDPPIYPSSVGAHVRHCVEHYALLIEGLASGRVDYEARGRDRRVEEDRDAAAALCQSLAGAVAALDEAALSRPLAVRLDSGEGGREEATWCASSLGRELQAMAGHATHHLAVVAMILRLQGLAPDDSLGLAPATRRWRRAAADATR